MKKLQNCVFFKNKIFGLRRLFYSTVQLLREYWAMTLSLSFLVVSFLMIYNGGEPLSYQDRDRVTIFFIVCISGSLLVALFLSFLETGEARRSKAVDGLMNAYAREYFPRRQKIIKPSFRGRYYQKDIVFRDSFFNRMRMKPKYKRYLGASTK